MTFATYAPRQPVGDGRGDEFTRTMPPLWLVIHTSEQGSESENSAEALCAFIATPSTPTNVASYHYVLDTDKVFPLVRDNFRANAAGGGNSGGLHVCFPGRAGQSANEWHDAISSAQLEQCARWLADKSVEYGIPLVRLGPADLAAGRKGVCGHIDVSLAFRQSTHTDPGPSFPYAEVIARAAQLLSPFPGQWPTFKNKPDLFLDQHPRGDAVKYLQWVLINKASQRISAAETKLGDYGPETAAGVRNLRLWLGLAASPNCGPRVWPHVDRLATS